jgi:hypothetical protein
VIRLRPTKVEEYLRLHRGAPLEVRESGAW